MSDQIIMIPNCDRDQIIDIIRMRNKGLSGKNIAQRKGTDYTTLLRYIRIYDLHGSSVFAWPQEQAA
jgi:hypothetical protein